MQPSFAESLNSNFTGCVLYGIYYNDTLTCSQLIQQLSISGTRNLTRLVIALLTFSVCVLLSIWTCIRRKSFPLPIHGFYYLQFTIFSSTFYGLFNFCLFTVVLLNQLQIISITSVIGLFSLFINLSMVQLVLQPAVVKLWLIGQSFYINKLKSRLLLFTDANTTTPNTVASPSSATTESTTATVVNTPTTTTTTTISSRISLDNQHWVRTNASQLKLKQIQRFRFVCLRLVPVLFILCSILIKIIEIGIFELGYIVTTWISPTPTLQKAFQVVYYAAIFLEFVIWPLWCILLYIFIAVLRVKEPFCLIGLSVVFVLVVITVMIALLTIAGLESAINSIADTITSYFYYLIDISVLIGVTITAMVPIFQTYSKRFNAGKNREIFKEEEDSIHTILNDYKIYKKFYEFSVKEWNHENLIFYQNFKNYKKESDYEKKWSILQQVCEQNMVPNAPLELNITNELVVKFNQYFKQKEMSLELATRYMDIVMDDIKKEILKNISDVLGRFKMTRIYKEWKVEHDSKVHAYVDLGWNKLATENL